MTVEQPGTVPDLTRRGVLRGVAVGGGVIPLLSACGDDTASPEPSPTGDASGSAEPSASASASGGAGVSVAAADVPVGGGTVLTDEKVVVTQPTKGEFKAFSAICTHQGCTVGSVVGGKIQCPCHGSMYSIEDGSVVGGPAPTALAAKKVSVEGDEIVVG